MSLRQLVFTLLVLFTSSAAFSEAILLPVVVNRIVPGAYESQWVTRLAVGNTGTSPLTIHNAGQICSLSDCVNPPDDTIPAGTTVVSYPLLTTMEVPGRFVRVDISRMSDLALNLRVQDLSRQTSTWGTELPVVAESAALKTKAELLNVPAWGDFRSLVRIYDFDPSAGHAVVVRIFRPAPIGSPLGDEKLKEFTLPLSVPSNPVEYAGYAELNVTTLGITPSIPPPYPATVVEVVRVEIVPATPGLRFYAFASVTNNASQHVTVIRP